MCLAFFLLLLFFDGVKNRRMFHAIIQDENGFKNEKQVT